MLFVTLTGSPTMEETTELSSIWEIGLYNNHIQATRYVIEEDRVMFVFTDGSLAWEAKDFLISQERCLEVELDSKVYPGLGAKSKQGSNSEEEKSRSESKKSGSKSKTSGSKTTPPESEPARVRSVEL
ncbi:LRP chaperone MESD [Eurytemora carolleeae]|uniref:LRP chaperone MESD n=1 Tax=Eurytemora carolleeae TaxID=1294199 RepID=UPI000C7760E9|nr:LRP chaperone MESD [Eurytemora carolleeae]|eukprot:XP_023331826.1 LRP chaperone MESD-like [Eurytemora affinis]